MSRVHVGIATGPIERVPADVAVVAFFDDERPLRGGAGRADWRLCGALSRLVRSGRLRGAFGDAALIPATGGLRARWVLALGLGSREDFDSPRRSAVAEACIRRALDLQARVIAVPLAPAGPEDPGTEARLDLLLEVLERAAPRLERPVEVRLVLSPTEHAALGPVLRERARAPQRPGLSVEWVAPVERPVAAPPAGRREPGPSPRSDAGVRVK